jgi:hypothetical protein
MPAMSDQSARLNLPFLMPSQAQKHITHNEALELLDALVQVGLASLEAETPPASPADGEMHALGAAPTGDWATHAGELAYWTGTGWLFLSPQTGWQAWDITAGQMCIWDGSAWVRLAQTPDQVDQLGIQTGADATNRLAVQSPATLFTHDGAGHQLKINKSSTGDTASLLFQSGWTGYAEMGLVGDNSFRLKVAGDGSWPTVLSADGSSLSFTGPVKTHTAGTGFSGTVTRLKAERTASANYNFLTCLSGDGADTEFVLAGDGNAYADGSWASGGADYAEYFEWLDGNPNNEDRRGLSVVLEGAKIRLTEDGEDPIGVISATPTIVGDSDMDHWRGKYMRDAFGDYVLEPQEVTDPETGIAAQQPCRVLNPNYDPALPYTPRALRSEWAIVGLIGKLRLRKGQPTDPRWIKIQDVSADLEDWLLR